MGAVKPQSMTAYSNLRPGHVEEGEGWPLCRGLGRTPKLLLGTQ